MSEYLVTWAADDEPRWEQVRAEITLGRLRARGTVLVGGKDPYQASYELVTSAGFVTRRLLVRLTGLDWSRELLLNRDSDGEWSARRTAEPDDGIPALTDPAELAGAIDCDLTISPLTNIMPVLRHVLHRREGRQELAIAWVYVPECTVAMSRQTYEHIRGDDEGGGVVRFTAGAFTADVEIAADGFVTNYPGVARRV